MASTSFGVTTPRAIWRTQKPAQTARHTTARNLMPNALNKENCPRPKEASTHGCYSFPTAEHLWTGRFRVAQPINSYLILRFGKIYCRQSHVDVLYGRCRVPLMGSIWFAQPDIIFFLKNLERFKFLRCKFDQRRIIRPNFQPINLPTIFTPTEVRQHLLKILVSEILVTESVVEVAGLQIGKLDTIRKLAGGAFHDFWLRLFCAIVHRPSSVLLPRY